MISEYSLLVNSVRLLDFKTGIKSINDLGEGAVTNDAKGNVSWKSNKLEGIINP